MRNKKIWSNVFVILAALCFVIVVWLVGSNVYNAIKSEQKAEELRGSVNTDETVQLESTAETETEAESQETTEPKNQETTEPVGLVENPYKELYSQNEDMAAWLIVDGTPIDYPVMQTMEDENYYLERDFEKNYDSAGCLILDTDSSLGLEENSNLIIHGHDMKAGTMFGTLDSYEDEAYWQEHKYMELHTETEKREYEVIAVFRSQVFYVYDEVFKYYKYFHADTEEEFLDFYNNIMSMSIYDTGVTAEYGDNFLTLSTCAYHVENGRFVVVAKEIDRSVKYAE